MTKIPKIIHQTAKDQSIKEISDNISSLKKNNEGWKHCFYDDKDIEKTILKLYNKEFLNLYLKINPKYGAARADFFRYLLMYEIGGVYLDIKSGTHKKLDDITLNKEYILSHWDNDSNGTHPGWGKFFKNFPNGEFQQWRISTIPHHPFLKRTIQSVVFNIQNYSLEKHGTGHIGTLKTTGPIVYTLSILSIINHVQNFHLYRTNKEAGFVYQNTQRNHMDILYNDEFKHYRHLDEPIILT
jgi:mannosyltransferase OCH1-like enzyme